MPIGNAYPENPCTLVLGSVNSFEPLLAETKLDPRDLGWAGISWVIVGQVTRYRSLLVD